MIKVLILEELIFTCSKEYLFDDKEIYWTEKRLFKGMFNLMEELFTLMETDKRAEKKADGEA